MSAIVEPEPSASEDVVSWLAAPLTSDGGVGGGIGGGAGFVAGGGGLGGGIGGGAGEPLNSGVQQRVSSRQAFGTSGVQHSLTVAVSGANVFPAGQVQWLEASTVLNRSSSHVGGGGGEGEAGGGGLGGGIGGGAGEAEGGGGDGFDGGGGKGGKGGGDDTSTTWQHSLSAGHVEPMKSAQHLGSKLVNGFSLVWHLHWLSGAPSRTHVGGLGGGIGGGAGGGAGGGIGGGEGDVPTGGGDGRHRSPLARASTFGPGQNSSEEHGGVLKLARDSPATKVYSKSTTNSFFSLLSQYLNVISSSALPKKARRNPAKQVLSPGFARAHSFPGDSPRNFPSGPKAASWSQREISCVSPQSATVAGEMEAKSSN